MSERLRIELEESKAEIARLRDRLEMGMPPIHKDLSLTSLIPKWSGAETAAPLEEFLASIEGAAKMGRWSKEDCVQLATLRLLDPARAFYNANVDHHATEVTWESFKAAFRGLGMCARISFIFANYKPRNKGKIRIRRNSQTAVRFWPKKLWAGRVIPSPSGSIARTLSVCA